MRRVLRKRGGNYLALGQITKKFIYKIVVKRTIEMLHEEM